MRWAMDYAPTDLSPTARHVLLILSDAVNDDTGECWPSIRRLIRRTGLSERTVQRAIVELEGRGVIRRVINGSPDERRVKHHRPNLYLWTPLGITCGEKGGEPNPKVATPRHSDTPPPVRVAPLPPATVAP